MANPHRSRNGMRYIWLSPSLDGEDHGRSEGESGHIHKRRDQHAGRELSGDPDRPPSGRASLRRAQSLFWQGRTAGLADIRGDGRRPDTLRHDFRGINPADAQILLIEGSDRILSTFPPHLSEAAERALI